MIIDAFARSPFQRALDNEIARTEYQNIGFEIIEKKIWLVKEHGRSNCFEPFFSRYKTAYTEIRWLFWRQIKNAIREPVATRILAIQTIVITLKFLEKNILLIQIFR
jgi:hypothetical protein